MILDVGIGLGAGLIAGLVFFGGLRWTLSRLESTRHPLLLTVTSFVVRGAVVAGALVALADGRLTRVLAGLVGIMAVRTVMVSLVRRNLDTAEESSWT